jgi:protein tyrosine/serine phosphatase
MPDGRLLVGELEPPAKFGMIEPGLYRSNYPVDGNFRFLQGLGLRTAVNLTQERLVRSALAFFAENGVRLLQLGESSAIVTSHGVKDEDLLKSALEIALDASHYPLLLMSSSGNHGVGLIVGCLRRIEGWAISAALDEYRSFAAPSARYMTEQAIELFDIQLIDMPAQPPAWYAQLAAIDDDERAWHEGATERARASGQPMPAFLRHYYGGFELLAEDEAAAGRYVNESDDD